MSSSNILRHRIELFFTDPNDLKARIRFLRGHGFSAFNLVNKNQKDTIHEWVECMQTEYPNADVCAHYSLKYNKVPRKGVEEHAKQFKDFLSANKAQEVLIISGSGKKTVGWNTIKALDVARDRDTSVTKIAVAYNPYFPEPKDQQEEHQRLQEKLASSSVSKVYLQFGTDLVRLKNALEDLKGRDVDVAASLFLPTKKLIAQQRFRPWNGVFLSPEFLSGPDNAEGIVLEMMKLYQQYNVEMLWEAPGIRNEKDLQIILDLVGKLGQQLVSETQDVNHEENKEVVYEQSRTDHETESSTSNTSKRAKLDDTTTKGRKTAVVVFGSHDIRLSDNQAIEKALATHERVVPVFLWSTELNQEWRVKGALEVILQDALLSLESSLLSFDLPLICRNCKEDGVTDLLEIVQESSASTVYWNRQHTPEGRATEAKRRAVLLEHSIAVEECQSSLLYDPDQIELQSGFHGGHWGTLMPFLKNCKKSFGEPRRPTPKYETFRLLQNAKGPETIPRHVSVKDLEIAVISGSEKWDMPIRHRFPMSEEEGHKLLEGFFQKGLRRYEVERSHADKEYATSQLSPHLRVGTISPNELYWRTEDSGLTYEQLKTFSRRMFWRELAYFQLRCFPDMRSAPIRKHYEQTKWVEGEEEKRRFEAWKKGKTGFPIVDAGMRELYATGWMTQSVRMVVASFLVEYLRINWVKGCKWFDYTLVDSDSAINAMMWNNAGKSGIDQWNFILSPVTASQDPSGAYVRKWVPELADLPCTAFVHRPWEAPLEVLEQANVVLGKTYPHRVIQNLKEERAKSVESTLETRRQFQEFNTDRGYDLIHLPDGKETVVFTKKEYRIDRTGFVLIDNGSSKAPASKIKKPRTRREINQRLRIGKL